jgi:hypothetical protein
MYVKLDIPDNQKHSINLTLLKEMWRKYGHRGKPIKPGWVENLMQEVDPYRFYLEWDIPEFSLAVITDIKKFLNACPILQELPIILPSGQKFIIRKNEKAVEIYERSREEI